MGSVVLLKTKTSKSNPPPVIEISKSTLPEANLPTEPLNVTKAKVTRLETEPEQVLLLDSEVDTDSVEILISQIQKLEKDYDDLYLVIDSPGGSVFDGARLASYMEASKARIHTVCYSLCASMAAQIHQHGKKRYMVDRSALMFHSAAGGLRGTVPSMKSLLTFIDREVQKLDAYVADRAKIARDQFGNLVIRDLWIAADDALKMNLSDGTVVITLNREEPDTFVLSRELIKRKITPKTLTEKINPLSEIR